MLSDNEILIKPIIFECILKDAEFLTNESKRYYNQSAKVKSR